MILLVLLTIVVSVVYFHLDFRIWKIERILRERSGRDNKTNQRG